MAFPAAERKAGMGCEFDFEKGNTMRRELAVYRSGRYVSNWPTVFLLGLITGLVGGIFYAAMRYMLSGQFSFISILFAIALGIGFFAGMSLRKCYMLQPEYASGNRRSRL